MNWGDSPVVTNVLDREYNASVQELGDEDPELGNYSIGPRESLMELKDRGYTPAMIAASTLTWKKAVRRFGVNALINFGIEFSHAAEMGFCRQDFEYMTTNQLIRMKARPYDLLAQGLHRSDLVRMKATLQDTKALGLTTPLLRQIGFTENNIASIGIDLATWRYRDPFYREPQTAASETRDAHLPELEEFPYVAPARAPEPSLQIAQLPPGELQF